MAADPSRAQALCRQALEADSTNEMAQELLRDMEMPAKAEQIPAETDMDAALQALLDSEAEISRPALSLADVGGLADVKRRLSVSFLGPMRNPEMRQVYKKSLKGGLLLYGPPGCGKTFIARALAGELGASFFAVGLHDVLEMWLGKSEQNLHAIFESARRNAPCVLFLDELDALGHKRSNLQHSAGRNVVVQLLHELDSSRDDNEGVFVLGATNQPWDVDPALRRPGRFDRVLPVMPPDNEARHAILAFHLKGRPVEDTDLAAISRATAGRSGADLNLICESAAELAMEDSLNSGTVRPIRQSDLIRAVENVRPSVGPWFQLARNYALYANEGGLYDEVLVYMQHNDTR
jgi:SpoVK/Ycf46/Vps4 family AAA+-type ATPase